MNKKNFKLFLVILWCGIIFFFSQQPSNQSSELTSSFFDTCLQVVENVTNTKIPQEQVIFLKDTLFVPIRKSAHFFEYFILGMLLFSLLKEMGYKREKLILLAILFSVWYACTDEIHQIFVFGRSARIFDVLIDSSGASMGAFLCFFFSQMKMKKRLK